MILKLDCLNDGLTDSQLFDDVHFWSLPEEEHGTSSLIEESTQSRLSLFEANLSVSRTCKYGTLLEWSRELH